MNDDQLDPAHAEAMMRLAATLTDAMTAAGRANPDLTWLNMVLAAAVACRGVAAVAMSDNPAIKLDDARRAMTLQFLEVMSMPAELVRTVKTKDDETPQTIVLPIRRH
jgi:hypothetical protein